MSDVSDTDSETIDIDINELLKKYKCPEAEKKLETQCNLEHLSNDSSSDDEFSNYLSLKDKFNLNSKPVENEVINIDQISENVIDSDNDVGSTQSKSKKTRLEAANDKLLTKQQKELQKLDKKAERERIKAENLKAKELRQNMMQAYKNLKPEECMKFITVVIDAQLISMECGAEIPTVLQSANISFKVSQQTVPSTITWIRKTQTQLEISNSQFQLTNNEENCAELLLIMMWNEFVELIHKKELLADIQIKQTQMPNRKLFLCIYGLENYFAHSRQHKNQSETQRNSKNNTYKTAPKITRKDADMGLIELQIMLAVSHRFLEKSQDVANLIAQFSKAIAQIPYRQQKQLKYEQMEWFISGDNKDCVRVNKDGNGLLRLWQQQITQFTLARLETAEAITSTYPSPLSLMNAYDKCESREQGEKLLQDIPIRRAAGPLTSVRKIGPELSKKIYTLFTSTDGNVFL